MQILCFKQKVTFDSHENVISNKAGRLPLYTKILYHQAHITIHMNLMNSVLNNTILLSIVVTCVYICDKLHIITQ